MSWWLSHFVEYNYAPSQFFHTGVRVVAPIVNQIALQAMFGYADGSTLSLGGFGLGQSVSANNPTSFSGFYFGIGANVFTRLFKLNELR